jgi:hypothetical protein
MTENLDAIGTDNDIRDAVVSAGATGRQRRLVRGRPRPTWPTAITGREREGLTDCLPASLQRRDLAVAFVAFQAKHYAVRSGATRRRVREEEQGLRPAGDARCRGQRPEGPNGSLSIGSPRTSARPSWPTFSSQLLGYARFGRSAGRASSHHWPRGRRTLRGEIAGELARRRVRAAGRVPPHQLLVENGLVERKGAPDTFDAPGTLPAAAA